MYLSLILYGLHHLVDLFKAVSARLTALVCLEQTEKTPGWAGMQESGLGTGCNSDESFPLNPWHLHSHVLSLLSTQFSKTNLLLPVPTPASDLEGTARAILLL